MQHKHWLKRYSIPSLLFVVGICIGFFLLFYINTTFRIKHVILFGATEQERKNVSSLLIHKFILTMQPTTVTKTIQGGSPLLFVQDVRIQFPDTVYVVIKKESPFAYLQTDYGYLTLSQTGTVLKKDRSPDQPKPFITFYQTVYNTEYQVGQKISYSAVVRALKFISVLTDAGYATETVAIDSVDMIACKTKGFEVAFSQTRPIDLQIHEVRQITEQVKIGALRIERLDLRFDKPVVQLPH